MMMVTENDILERLGDLLAELAGLPVKPVRQGEKADLRLRLGSHLLAVEVKTNSRAGVVAQAAENARQAADSGKPTAIPLVAVPFMGEVGREICRECGVSYVDMSGNGDINAPGLRIHVAGKPNLFVQQGRPSSVFAPKSSRLARILLAEPKRWWRQAELASAGQLGAGYVSRICRRLEEDHLIERDSEGSVRPRDPNLLLEAWQAQYDLRRHDIRQGHVAARSGEELARQVAEACRGLGFDYALTGLAAAWLLAPFAGFRLVTVYLRKSPNDKLLQRLKWHEEKQGANLWLIRPNDEGVFHGAQNVKSTVCVSPVQALSGSAQPAGTGRGSGRASSEGAAELVVSKERRVAADCAPGCSELARRTCLEVATLLGDFCEQMCVVGGLAPSLIIDQAHRGAGVEEHIGTIELDLDLSIAVLDDQLYKEIAGRLRDADFSPDKNPAGKPTTQRWVSRQGVTVDFLIPPSSSADRGGRLRNLEEGFAAIITPALDLAFQDVPMVELAGTLPSGGAAVRTIQVCGPGAFIVLKALAFDKRGKPKDAYDLYYVPRNHPDSVERIGQRIRGFADRSEVRDAASVLRWDFARVDAVGPTRVAESLGGPDDTLQADVAGFIRSLLESLT